MSFLVQSGVKHRHNYLYKNVVRTPNLPLPGEEGEKEGVCVGGCYTYVHVWVMF